MMARLIVEFENVAKMQRFFIFAAEMYGFERFCTVLYDFVRNGTFLNFLSARMIKGEFALLPIEISSCKGKGGSGNSAAFVIA